MIENGLMNRVVPPDVTVTAPPPLDRLDSWTLAPAVTVIVPPEVPSVPGELAVTFPLGALTARFPEEVLTGALRTTSLPVETRLMPVPTLTAMFTASRAAVCSVSEAEAVTPTTLS